MSSGGWFLVMSVSALASTAFAMLRLVQLPLWPLMAVFALGLITSELTLYMLGIQVLLSLLFISQGALAHGSGLLALLLMLVNWMLLFYLHYQSGRAKVVLQQSLEQGLGDNFVASIPLERQATLRSDIVPGEWLKPFSFPRPGVELIEDIPYGEAGRRNHLDIYRPTQAREGGFPVLLQIHGGGWTIGHKREQGQVLMNHMAHRGWICVAINYRLSPRDKFPAHIIDVKKAIKWVKDSIAEYGGNPDFIAVTGGSAGGHLSALAALSANDPAYQPGFESVDTTVQAAVPLYGVYDFLDQGGFDHNKMIKNMLPDQVMGCTAQENPDLWRQASPVARVHAQAPPFFVIHGRNDVLTAPLDAWLFVGELRKVAQQPVLHAELPCAEHAFDFMHSVRTDHTINHIAAFLEWCHANAH